MKRFRAPRIAKPNFERSRLLRAALAGAFSLSFAVVVVAANCPLSVSGATQPTLAVDGVLLARYAAGLRGAALIASIRPSPALPATVESAIAQARAQLDVDDDGAFTSIDSLILSRQLAGYRQSALTQGITFAPTALRQDSAAIAAYIGQGCPLPLVASFPANDADAARFLAQATFGVTDTDIARVKTLGYSAWIDEQLAKPSTKLLPFMDRIEQTEPYRERHLNAWWYASMTGQDQLRQRVAFALSQIFVISTTNMVVNGYRFKGPPSYYDMLLDGSFGSYRSLIEKVTLHPMMGLYLSHFGNKKEDPVAGVRPDENYAREIMQLFSIGLYELNTDGTRKLLGGNPIPTYGQADITGLAKVFTGWGWGGLLNTYFWDRDNTGFVFPELLLTQRPMEPRDDFHSTSQKQFLGITIPAQTTANARASLTPALNRIASHPNVGPFIGRQLIQHLVTSNPSPLYVERVAAAFNNSNGNLGATVKAILLDPEARNANYASANTYGRLREPLLRLTHFARSFKLVSRSGDYGVSPRMVPGDPDASVVLGQDPLGAPSVFNYFRPGFTPPNTSISAASLVAPQFQITNETTVGNWIFSLEIAAEQGFGRDSDSPFSADIETTYSAEVPLADRPDVLIDRINTLLFAGQMSQTLRADVREGINTVAMPSTNQANARRKRVQLAILLAMSSPEYLVQK